MQFNWNLPFICLILDGRLDVERMCSGECPMCPDVSAVNDEDSETASKGLPIGKIAVIVVALVCVALLVRACF